MKIFLSIKKIKAIIEIEWNYPMFPKADDKICISDFIKDNFSNIFKEEEYDVKKKVLIPFSELENFDLEFVHEIHKIRENIVCILTPQFKYRKNKEGEIYAILYATL